jgi:hypothetical protein
MRYAVERAEPRGLHTLENVKLTLVTGDKPISRYAVETKVAFNREAMVPRPGILAELAVF